MTNAELTLKTKQALALALRQAMEKKPLSKITISELAAACHINRKTFYYHFQDVYDLLKWTLEQEAADVAQRFDLADNAEEAIRFIMHYAEEEKHIINCALDAMGGEELARFFYVDLFSVIRQAVDRKAEELNLVVEESFLNFLTSFYTEAFAGLLLRWYKNRRSLDREAVLQNILLIFQVSIPAILQANACTA